MLARRTSLPSEAEGGTDPVQSLQAKLPVGSTLRIRVCVTKVTVESVLTVLTHPLDTWPE